MGCGRNNDHELVKKKSRSRMESRTTERPVSPRCKYCLSSVDVGRTEAGLLLSCVGENDAMTSEATSDGSISQHTAQPAQLERSERRTRQQRATTKLTSLPVSLTTREDRSKTVGKEKKKRGNTHKRKKKESSHYQPRPSRSPSRRCLVFFPFSALAGTLPVRPWRNLRLPTWCIGVRKRAKRCIECVFPEN